MHTDEQVAILLEEANDSFYFTAYLLNGWLKHISEFCFAQYSFEKSDRRRKLQSGFAREILDVYLKSGVVDNVVEFHAHVKRYGEYRSENPELVRRALILATSGSALGTPDFHEVKTADDAVQAFEGVVRNAAVTH